MSREVQVNSTDWSIRFSAFDSEGAAVTGETHASAGMAISVVVRRKGRIVSTTALSLSARDVAGVHKDSALTEVGGGDYTVDIADGYLATVGDVISLAVASDAITGWVYVETIEIVAGGGLGTDYMLLQSTTIATLASQTSFTLTAGSADNNAYKDRIAVITDQATATQKAVVQISAYVGATKTVTLASAPAFTIATGDTIDILATSDLPTGVALASQLSGVTVVTVTGYGLLDADGVLQLKEGQTGTIAFTAGSDDIVPDMTGATCYFSVRDDAGRTLLQVEGTIVTPTGTQVVQFSVDAASALKLRNGRHKFDVMIVYGYDANAEPPYTGLKQFTAGPCEVTRLELRL